VIEDCISLMVLDLRGVGGGGVGGGNPCFGYFSTYFFLLMKIVKCKEKKNVSKLV